MNTRKPKAQIPRFQPMLELLMFKRPNAFGIALAIFLILSVLGSPLYAATADDPLEKMNRITHGFNRTLDCFIVKPLAVNYQRFTPGIIRSGVHNFFSNLDDVQVTFNDLMQFKFSQATADFSRFALNSTVGVGGLINVAGPVFELPKHQQDFGKTLAGWGVKSGPYLVLPFFGPSTLRDGFAVGVDALVDPVPAVDHVKSRNGLIAGKTTDYRAAVLGFDDLVVGDDYLFIRGIYLQHREYQISGDAVNVAFEEF